MRSSPPLLCVLASCLLAGCGEHRAEEFTQEYVDTRRAIHRQATDFADAWYCRGMSLVEFRRRFPTAESQAGWRAICAESMAMPVIEPDAP